MGSGILQPLLLIVLILLLVSAGIEDVRTRTIGNAKNVAIALLAPVWWWACGMPVWPDMAIQLTAALVVFGLFIGLFAMGWMGGGDVKLIGALALWLPPGLIAWMLVVMSAIGGLLTIAMLVDRRVARREGPVEVPYGVAIVCAAMLAIS